MVSSCRPTCRNNIGAANPERPVEKEKRSQDEPEDFQTVSSQGQDGQSSSLCGRARGEEEDFLRGRSSLHGMGKTRLAPVHDTQGLFLRRRVSAERRGQRSGPGRRAGGREVTGLREEWGGGRSDFPACPFPPLFLSAASLRTPQLLSQMHPRRPENSSERGVHPRGPAIQLARASAHGGGGGVRP
ncbi:hypothetical protein THAOC_31374 [Thalassiosira oceanica]|uniref:Uncharacterized protein n=1 Tax=Thalassiosira oceanica TaxID=159749 RepID=K0RSX1_THAOC|nr:hypothetical protein THAOC_31374 [Thalassiosira oceanica]|eukprot:EJK49717.1 hypothetical protein THAOC_31374 [Thalassiosira oceanica]